ncbi:MAG: hypothetical protein Q8S73_22990 [Deltaproteobacteria bacterium]|nr:hypothetical protein [Myxococcales bacterium]MDP3216995.1 hypothetical protein [Deltaproteobacteria bacterium]
MFAVLVSGCAVGSDPSDDPLDAAVEESDLEVDAGDEPVEPEDAGDEPVEPEDAAPDVPALIDATADAIDDRGFDARTDDGSQGIDVPPDAVLIDSSTNTDAGFDAGFDTGFDAVETVVDSGVAADAGERRCPAGMFVTGLAAGGALVCSDLADAVRRYVDGSCRVHLGWQDTCNGCAGPPAKWGSVGASTCAIGGGADNSCIAASAGSAPVQLFGVNPDGDVDGNDVLYAGIACSAPASVARTGGCPAGQFATGFDAAGQPLCAALDPAARTAIGRDCFLYGGWRDECPRCTVTPPTKWDRVNDSICQNLVGPNGDTCTQPSLGGTPVRMLGLDFDGDVNNDDQIYVGLRCEASGGTQGSGAVDACPRDQAAYGIGANRALLCAPVDPVVHTYFASSCYLYLGWQDSCGGCTRPPVKWGRVSPTTCDNGAGADNTCTMQTLGSTALPMFGLNFDGDVDNNDLLNLGLHCF